MQLVIDERNHLLAEAAKFFPGAGDREVARRLRTACLRYQAGAWRREQAALTCPERHVDKLGGLLWQLLKGKDHTPSEATIRAALYRSRRAAWATP
ncbi:hypothetical protein [Bradyrhizobium sp. 14AA]